MPGNFSLFDGLQEFIDEAPDKNGIPKFQEDKFKRYLKNHKMGSPNKIIFEQNEPKFSTCPRYNPCPICYKCMNKASHLYVSCQTCKIPICTHKYEDRIKMIKQENFSIPVYNETYQAIEELDRQITGEQ